MRMLITPAPTSFPDVPTDDLIPYFLALSDVLGTGCFGAVAAKAGPRKTVAVVREARSVCSGCWPRSSSAERIIAMSRH